MAGGVQYNYEPIDRNAIAEYLSNDFYNPPPQGGIPLPPRRPVDMFSFEDMPYQFTPDEQRQVNEGYQRQTLRERASNFYPPAMRAQIGSYFGNENPITQHNFSQSDLNALRDDYLEKRANYTAGFFPNPLTGFQKGSIPDVSRMVSYDQFTQDAATPHMQGLGSMFRGLNPFLEGAYYEQSPEGTHLRNYYNNPSSQRDVNVLLPMEPR